MAALFKAYCTALETWHRQTTAWEVLTIVWEIKKLNQIKLSSSFKLKIQANCVSNEKCSNTLFFIILKVKINVNNNSNSK